MRGRVAGGQIIGCAERLRRFVIEEVFRAACWLSAKAAIRSRSSLRRWARLCGRAIR